MEDLAKLLGTNQEKLTNLVDEMSEFTGRKDVADKFMAEILQDRQDALNQLGLEENVTRSEVLGALTGRVELLEEEAKKLLGEPKLHDHEFIRGLFSRSVGIAKPKKGLFLKEEKARELFRQNPPKNILARRIAGRSTESQQPGHFE